MRQVRVDAGPTLNGVLLQAGLADEASVVFAPHLAGRELTLDSLQQLRNEHLWLRYRVSNFR